MRVDEAIDPLSWVKYLCKDVYKGEEDSWWTV